MSVYVHRTLEIGGEHAFESGAVLRPWLTMGVPQFWGPPDT